MSAREDYLTEHIRRIKDGGTVLLRCVMSTSDRLSIGLCLGTIPADRAHKNLHTCSSECAADLRRLMRWERSKGKCRMCGHGMPKKLRDEMLAKRGHKK